MPTPSNDALYARHTVYEAALHHCTQYSNSTKPQINSNPEQTNNKLTKMAVIFNIQPNITRLKFWEVCPNKPFHNIQSQD
jgi:hypothetical protein